MLEPVVGAAEFLHAILQDGIAAGVLKILEAGLRGLVDGSVFRLSSISTSTSSNEFCHRFHRLAYNLPASVMP